MLDELDRGKTSDAATSFLGEGVSVEFLPKILDHGEVELRFDRGFQKEGEDSSDPTVLTTRSLPSSLTISPTPTGNVLVASSGLLSSPTRIALGSGGSDLSLHHFEKTSSSCLTPPRRFLNRI